MPCLVDCCCRCWRCLLLLKLMPFLLSLVGVGNFYHCPDQFRTEGCKALSFLKLKGSSCRNLCRTPYMTTLSPSAPPTEAREREFFVSKTSLFDQKNEVLNAKIGVRNILGNCLHFSHPPQFANAKKNMCVCVCIYIYIYTHINFFFFGCKAKILCT